MDRQSLNHIDRIDPLFVEGYLLFNGWKKNGEIPNGKASIWQREIGRDFFSVIFCRVSFFHERIFFQIILQATRVLPSFH